MGNCARFSIVVDALSACSRVGFAGVLSRSCLLVLVFSGLCLSGASLAQTQVGADIDGEAIEDSFGSAISLSSNGNRMAVGAPFNDGNGGESGHVRIYDWTGASWTQIGGDIDGGAGDQSGAAISLSSDGSRVAIGAPWAGDSFSGHVQVYQWSGMVWSQLGSDISGEAGDDQFGAAVSMSADGNRVAIGGWASVFYNGRARVYEWSGVAWEQMGAAIDCASGSDLCGMSISISADGTRVAIGAPGNSDNGASAGQVRVFEWLNGNWMQMGADINGEAASDASGSAVSLSPDGSRLAIGAVYNDGNGQDSGHVRVYQWSGGAWVQMGADVDGEASGDSFGVAVSLSADGNYLAAGGHTNDGNGTDSGHVRIYHWTGSAWQQAGMDIDGESSEDLSGRSVSLSSDGTRVAIGATSNDGNGQNAGHVRVYTAGEPLPFKINAGLNDAWYYDVTDGQGFFINVFPVLNAVTLAWFTYDTELPPVDAIAYLGDPGHRWLTAVGPINGNQVLMDIEFTSGGIFDTQTDIIRTDPPGSDGTLLLTFDSCNSGTIEYDIPSINRQGIVPIERVVSDNIALCEVLASQ